jgi:hypothetical protein
MPYKDKDKQRQFCTDWARKQRSLHREVIITSYPFPDDDFNKILLFAKRHRSSKVKIVLREVKSE